MDSPLVDDEGFPIAELDTYLIKKTRQEINCKLNNSLIKAMIVFLTAVISGLMNDRKELEKQVVTALGELHKENSDATMETDVATTVHRTSNEPIARVDAVDESGAASRAGICMDDQVIQFGELHAGNFTDLHQLKDVVSNGVSCASAP